MHTDTSHWHAPSVPKLEAFYSDGHQFLRSGGGYAHHRPSSRQMWLLHCGCRPCALCSTSTSTSERDRKPLRTQDGMLCRPDQVGDPQLGLILFLRPSAPHTPLRIFLRWARYVGKMPLCPSTCHVRRALPQRRACGSEASRAGHAMQTGVTDACGRRRSRRGVLDAPSSASALQRSEGVNDDGDSLERRQVSFGRAN